MSLREFLAMGSYGGYIWSCYAVTLAMLIFSAWSARRSRCASRSAPRGAASRCRRRSGHDMTPRRRRMVLVGLIVLGVGAAAAFALTAFQDNLLYYYPPSDVAAGKAPADRVFRLGGMVEEGSLKRADGQHGSALRRHRFSEGRDRQLQRRAAGSVSRRAGRDRARPARMPTACSSRRKCWRSTTRTTCRRKWPRACASSTNRRLRRRRRRRERDARNHAMAAELGHFALILAFCLALPQAFFGLAGAAYAPPALDGADDARRRGPVRVHCVRVRLPRVLVLS